MRDHKSIFVDPASDPIVPSVPVVQLVADTLPVLVRVADRLADVLVYASELRSDLEKDEAAPLRWIAPTIERVFDEANVVMRRLAS